MHHKTEAQILADLQEIERRRAAGEYDKPKTRRKLPDTDDLIELARAAIPDLVRRAVDLAHESENLGQVLAVVKELADRAHGKPHQAIAVDSKTTVGMSDPLIDLLRQINESGQTGIRIAEQEDKNGTIN